MNAPNPHARDLLERLASFAHIASTFLRGSVNFDGGGMDQHGNGDPGGYRSSWDQEADEHSIHLERLAKEAEALLAQQGAAGEAGDWVLVPRGLTSAMMKAGIEAHESLPPDAKNALAFDRIYNAQIAAAPQAPATVRGVDAVVFVESSGLDCVLNAGASVLSAYTPRNATKVRAPLTALYAAHVDRAGQVTDAMMRRAIQAFSPNNYKAEPEETLRIWTSGESHNLRAALEAALATRAPDGGA